MLRPHKITRSAGGDILSDVTLPIHADIAKDLASVHCDISAFASSAIGTEGEATSIEKAQTVTSTSSAVSVSDTPLVTGTPINQ
jgi:hypothetical protein